MKLVSNWKDAWKWHSTQAMVFAASLPFIWAEVPEDVKMFIPPGWMPYITAAVLIGGLLGRLRDQTKS